MTTTAPTNQAPSQAMPAAEPDKAYHSSSNVAQLARHVADHKIPAMGPSHGLAPPVTFWQKLAKTQEAAQTIEKSEKMEAKGKRKEVSYSTTEEWIRQTRNLFLANGLICTMAMEKVQVDERAHASGPDGRCVGLVIELSSGLGWHWVMDRPTTGALSNSSPSHQTTGAFTDGIKQLLRGILLLDQASPDEIERDGPIGSFRGPAADLPPPPPPGGAQSVLAHGGAPPPRPSAPVNDAGTAAAAAAVTQEPMVRSSQEILGSDPVQSIAADLPPSGPPDPADMPAPTLPPPPAPPAIPTRTSPAPEAGTQDPMTGVNAPAQSVTFEALVAKGWPDERAQLLVALPGDQPINKELQALSLEVISEYFDGQWEDCFPLWEGTGFTPEPGSGKLPTAGQLRKFCAKLDWNKKKQGG